MTKKYFSLLDSYKKDLKKCHSIFVESKGFIETNNNKAPLPRNMPLSSGSIRWTDGILSRFVPKFNKFSELNDALSKSEEYTEVDKL